MREYEVTWSIYIESSDPEAAAADVKAILEDPAVNAWTFITTDIGTGERTMVDVGIDPAFIETLTERVGA